MTNQTLGFLLEQANRAGARGKKFVSCLRNPNFSATSLPENEYIVFFKDNSGGSASDPAWP